MATMFATLLVLKIFGSSHKYKYYFNHTVILVTLNS